MMRFFPALVICAGLLGLPGAAVQAETPAPFPEFQPKFVKPPKAGQRRAARVKINRQSFTALPSAEARPAPAQAAAAAAIAPSGAIARPRSGAYDWFWEQISPAAAQSGPGRLEKALRTLSGATAAVPAPRLQHMQQIATAHGVDILRASIGTRVSPALALAVISVESSGRATAESHAGAQGLMQLMPATAERFGVADSLEPGQNIAGGIRYLDWLMGEFEHDPILVLAGYNAGEGAVRKHSGVPPFAETRDYVPKVLAAFQVARGLCKTPPELISDGCVFHTMK